MVIPTVPGREDDLERTVDAYESSAPCMVQPMYGYTTVGAGWTAGVGEALERGVRPEFVQFGNDDMWPDPGWYEAAVETIGMGATPCPLMYKPDGSFESGGVWTSVPVADETIVGWTPLPFFRLDEWERLGPIPPIHYFSDCWFATASIYRLRRPIMVRHAYRFTHSWAQPGRKSEHDVEYHEAGALWREFEARCKAAADSEAISVPSERP